MLIAHDKGPGRAPTFELASVLVRFDHVGSGILNADHCII
jgi:hypothetical protein